jgi:hypothetical protein
MIRELGQAISSMIEAKIRDTRTVIVGKVKAVITRPNGERDAQFEAGVGMRQGGVEKSDGVIPGAPILTMMGGGFGIYMPSLPMDEAVGLVSDRSLTNWRLSKIPGKAPAFDQQHHDLTDTMLLPFGFTVPATGPAIGGQDFVMFSTAGDMLRVAALDGTVTITKNHANPLMVSTIVMDPLGSITMTVPTGQTIMAGDELAEALVKFQTWDTVMTAMLTAGAATPPSPLAGNNGSLAFNAAKIAYDAAKAPAQTTKLMGT